MDPFDFEPFSSNIQDPYDYPSSVNTFQSTLGMGSQILVLSMTVSFSLKLGLKVVL